MNCVLVNVVMQTQLLSDKTIDLRVLARDLPNVIYNPGRFSGMVWKHKNIGGCCLLFTNGKMIINGFDSISKCRLGTRRYARALQKKTRGGHLRRIKTVTMTVVADIEQKLCLEEMAVALKGHYESELFNALTLRKGKIHFAVFQSGKIVVTGLKNLNDIDRIVHPALLEMMLV